jgi:hypothetical protein
MIVFQMNLDSNGCYLAACCLREGSSEETDELVEGGTNFCEQRAQMSPWVEIFFM